MMIAPMMKSAIEMQPMPAYPALAKICYLPVFLIPCWQCRSQDLRTEGCYDIGMVIKALALLPLLIVGCARETYSSKPLDPDEDRSFRTVPDAIPDSENQGDSKPEQPLPITPR